MSHANTESARPNGRSTPCRVFHAYLFAEYAPHLPTACLSRYDYQRLHARQSHLLAELCHPGGILHVRRFGHGLICRTNGAF